MKIFELRDVRFREDSFKKLIIKARHKTVVKAMVRSYVSKEPIFGDLIQGKGRGPNVLLHGRLELEKYSRLVGSRVFGLFK